MERPNETDPRWVAYDSSIFADETEYAAGDWIKYENGEVYLVGDLNMNGGSCSCCAPDESGEVVSVIRSGLPPAPQWVDSE